MTFREWFDKELAIYNEINRMRKMYHVHMTLECDYDIEAESAEEARAIAEEWWDECEPWCYVEETREDEV